MGDTKRRRKAKSPSRRAHSQPPPATGGRRGNAAANRLYSMANQQREKRDKAVANGSNKPQTIVSEKKMQRDKRIEESYFNALRPDIPGKPEFRFDMKEEKMSYNTQGGGKDDYKSEHEALAHDEKRRAKMEKEWLDGLRPPIPGKEWNLDTELDRPDSPEKIFHSDDEY